MALRRLQPLPSLRELGDRPPVTWAGEATPSPVVASRQQAPVSPFVQPFAKALPQYVSPSPVIKKPVYRDIKPPIAKAEPSVAKPDEPPEDVEFWERALQVFAAPFVWVDEYVIKPTLSIAPITNRFLIPFFRKAGEAPTLLVNFLIIFCSFLILYIHYNKSVPAVSTLFLTCSLFIMCLLYEKRTCGFKYKKTPAETGVLRTVLYRRACFLGPLFSNELSPNIII